MRKTLLFTGLLWLWVSLAWPHAAFASGDLNGVLPPCSVNPSGPCTLIPGCWNGTPQTANFTPAKYSYTFAGTCDLAHTRVFDPPSSTNPLGDNPFAIVPWSGTSTYEPATGNTAEDIIVPAPRIDEPSRPYGQFTVTMHCPADPWLNQDTTCDRIVPTKVYSPLDNVAPNAIGWKPAFKLGPYLIDSINSQKRPFTSYLTVDARNNLNRLYGAYQAKLAEQRKEQLYQHGQSLTPQQRQALADQATAPSILSPAPGQTFFAQNPIPIRLAAPAGWNATTYMVSVQRKDATGHWIVQTSIPVTAAEAQSPQGYTGFGAGGTGSTKSPVFLTAPGQWGIAAQVASPRQSGWSNLVEFAVTNSPYGAPARSPSLLKK